MFSPWFLRKYFDSLVRRKEAILIQRKFSNSLPRAEIKKLKFSYVNGCGSKPLVALTLGQLVDRSAEKFGEKEALRVVQQKVRRNFIELKRDIDKLAAGFISLGLEPGDRIGIWGPNTYEWYLTQFAAGKAGLVLVNINPAYQPEELRYCLNKAGVKAVVSEETFKTQDYYGMMLDIAPEIVNANKDGTIQSKSVPSLQRLIMTTQKEFRGSLTFEEVCGKGTSKEMTTLNNLQSILQPDDPFNIQFTSGTTGRPKGACLTHHGVINNARFVGHRIGYGEKAHKAAVPVPLYHCFGCVLGTIALMNYGATCVLPSYSFNAVEALKSIQDENCTSVYGTPTMFVDMLNVQRDKKFDLSSLETGIMAGSPCPQQLCKDVMTEMNMKNFVVAYGSTETSPVSFLSYPSDSEEKKTSTVGYIADHLEAKVVDANDKIVPVNQPGELCTRGYSTMLGYWDDEEKTKEAITRDRWFHTGDQAIIDEYGYAQIVGRIKDMIIRGGENISPREIEEVLHTHSDILEAQVVGVPDSRMGEEVCAWIRTKAQMTPMDVKQFLKGKIAHFKVPRYIHFTESFPTTVTGKIQKFKIQEESVKIFKLK